MIEVITGDTALLELVLADGDTSRFPQAEIYDNAGVAIGASPVNLSHVADGLYQGTLTAPAVGGYSIIYITYSDAGHTTLVANIERVSEHMRVTNSVQDDVWDEALAGHLTAGSTGLALDNASAGGSTPAAISAAVWAEALPGAFGVGEAGKIVGDNVNATISSRSTLTQADILSDATPFAGASIDATISSRGTADPGDAMTLTAGERTAIDAQLSGTHGAGNWESASATDWTGAEKQQIRQALGVTGLTAATAAGELQDVLADTAAMEPLVSTNLNATVSSRSTLVQTDILSDAAPFAGANVDATISSRSTLTQADILSDATPFPGADIDAAISSRSSHTAADVDALVTASHGAGSYITATGFAVAGDNMGLTAAGVDAVWDEPIAGHLGVGSVGEALNDASSGAGVDWTVSERSQMRQALGITGATLATAAGELQDVLADTAAIEPLVTTNVDATISSRSTLTQADILSDATPFAGASISNLDATVSSRSTLVQADILSDATPFPGADIDAAISTRSSHTAADVDALVTASHGAGSYQTATGFAVAGDNMGLTPAATAAVDVELTATHGAGAWTGGGASLTQQQVRDAMKLAPTAGVPAAGSVDIHLDDIEADTSAMQPVVSANLDATVSSRGTADPGDAMTLTAGERTAIDTELSGTHGAGIWESDSDTDWTSGEKEQIRQALGVTGATAATAAGELQDVLADTAAMQPTIATNLDVAVSTRATPGDAMSLDAAGVDAIFDESLAGHLATGTAGQALAAAFGNAGGNVRDDALTYDANDRPLTLRRRIFPDAATANASTPGGVGEGELMTVTISATQIDAAKWETLLRTV